MPRKRSERSSIAAPRHRKPRWGQVFLVDDRISRAIVAAAVLRPDEVVIEVGPGRGALTQHLLAAAAGVLAVEVDPALAEAAQARFPAACVLQADALQQDWSDLASRALALAEGCEHPVAFVANLPYDVATPILVAWLERAASDPRLGRAIIMVQAEVGDRLAAGPGSKAYGALGALAQLTHAVRPVLEVAPGSFRPAPQVRSRVVRLDRLAQPLVTAADWQRASRFVQRAFLHRRKQLRVALAGTFGRSREDWSQRLAVLGLPEDARIEVVPPRELVQLAKDVP